ncbi:hypothetical protein D3C87_1486060 [compost metagenome]
MGDRADEVGLEAIELLGPVELQGTPGDLLERTLVFGGALGDLPLDVRLAAQETEEVTATQSRAEQASRQGPPGEEAPRRGVGRGEE